MTMNGWNFWAMPYWIWSWGIPLPAVSTWPEGELTRAKASAVCKPACAECAAKFHIGDYMRLGRGEEMSGGRTRISILGDAFEAVIGAIYLDNDYQTASRFILGHMKKFLDAIDRETTTGITSRTCRSSCSATATWTSAMR